MVLLREVICTFYLRAVCVSTVHVTVCVLCDVAAASYGLC